jgi:GntR family transcriptional regulator/MocR family aminotransferase
MAKAADRPGRGSWSEFLELSLDPASGRPLYVQIHLWLREAIVSGALAPGTRLPSSRRLAARLRVSRMSAIAAYEQLIAEGYAVGRRGSGTYVADDVPPPVALVAAGGPADAGARARVSAAGQRYHSVGIGLEAPARSPFVVGCCAVDGRTIEAWRRIGAAEMRQFDRMNLAYADPAGEPALRREIAAYLRAARAVHCAEDQVIVLSGAQQAIDLTIRTLLEPGDAVWIEDPGYPATREALQAAGARLVPVPVDASGLDVAAAKAAAPAARVAYITPSHQYPTGAVMSMPRRLELLAWAAEAGAWIVEDDYDSEFRFAGKPLSSLQGLDRGGRVIYVGTLSKVLFPGLRLGYAVLPPSLVDTFRGARYLTDRSPPTLQQAMTAEFMRQGLLASHIRRMRQVYRAARDMAVAALEQHLGDLAGIGVPEGGMQLIAYLRSPASDQEVAAAAREVGLFARPLSPLYLAAPPRQGLVLGYSGFDPHQIRTAAARLGRVAREALRGGRTTAKWSASPGQSGP